MLAMTRKFHILMGVVLITQVPLRWTQMLQCGKELPSMMERSMEKSNTKKTLMIFKLMEKLKRLLLTQEFHTHLLLFNLKHQLNMLVMIRNFHTLTEVVLITQVLPPWTQMPLFGKEVLSMMAKFTVRNNTKKMPTTSKHTVKLKRLLLTQEFLMHPLLFNSILQLNMPRMIKVSHILMEVVLITQVLLQWIQTNQYGKEQQFMTVRPMVRNNIKKMQMISKLMVKPKRQLQTLEFLMLQLSFKWKLQVPYLFQTLVFHILQELLITQVPLPWTQMLLSGKEKISMMVKYTVKKNIKRTPTTYKLTVKPKKLLLTLDSHMLQL
jgi:hypothetical protein